MITGVSSRRLGLLIIFLALATLSLVFLYTTTRRPEDLNSYTSKTTALAQTQTYISNTASSLSSSQTEWEQCLEPGQEPSYYLSIVIVTRMDDYAG